MKKEFILYLIIAFLLGVIVMDYAQALKIPDTILPDSVDPDLQEKLDYITDILNNGRYAISISGSAITSSDELDAGIPVFDNSGVSKYLVISSGDANYRVELTAIP